MCIYSIYTHISHISIYIYTHLLPIKPENNSCNLELIEFALFVRIYTSEQQFTQQHGFFCSTACSSSGCSGVFWAFGQNIYATTVQLNHFLVGSNLPTKDNMLDLPHNLRTVCARLLNAFRMPSGTHGFEHIFERVWSTG